jgi:hypothetical protein
MAYIKKHTKGTWYMEDLGHQIVIKSSNNKIIAILPFDFKASKSNMKLDDIEKEYQQAKSEQVSNAKLILHSKELLQIAEMYNDKLGEEKTIIKTTVEGVLKDINN